MVLTLFQSDFTAAEKVKDVINNSVGGHFSKCLDLATIQINVPDSFQNRLPEWMASLGRLGVVPDSVDKAIFE